MNKNLLLRGSVGKEAASCFYLDFGDAGGSVTISSNTLKSFNYSLDKQQWNVVSPGGTITVNSGKVYLCAATPVTSLFSQDVSSNKWTISGSNVKAGGNINTLLNADDPDGVVYSPYTFAYLFYGCTSLTEAPALPATTLANHCYNNMFYQCSKLAYIKCLATNISASNCTYNWVYGVAKSGTFVKAPSMTSWETGTRGIPSGWTVQNA